MAQGGDLTRAQSRAAVQSCNRRTSEGTAARRPFAAGAWLPDSDHGAQGLDTGRVELAARLRDDLGERRRR
jgi:hypothetical protein